MHPTLEIHNQEQANLETAKAAFFASDGTAQFIRPGVGKDSPGISHEPKRPYGYARIAPKTKRGRVITPDHEVVICAQLVECRKAGMTRYKASKHVGISETLCRRLIADHSLDFPKAG
ncbi:hypothetical protein PSH70_18155 [Pseudomonas fluorescens]|uniref:hypothetical protein n=1 Tax=Pseudomonas fluorescens TaxID=294 RepID=UPI002734B497|nr:hypothetical protein [Pseudomonas fluorescens]WLH71903.1 hypothetical protein PSH70_18155 [Pseudomonas fluorescens]